MRLGYNAGYMTSAADLSRLRGAIAAEKMGYSVVWAAEAYGSDAATVLSWIAAQTTTMEIGSAIFQIPARTPAMTAMTAATLDVLSGGRFRLGLGVSGPQVAEGWHGARFDKPLARTEEYIAILRKAFRRETVVFDGEHYTLPLPDGPGKPLKLMLHPEREHLPIYLAAVGPKNLQLTGRVADGWLSIFPSAEFAAEPLGQIAAGRTEAGRDMTGFDAVANCSVVIGDDPRECARRVSHMAALYVGGMGSRKKNFYNDLAVRMGFGEAAKKVQDLYLAKEYEAAAAAVPFEFIDATALLGPVDRIAERITAYAEAGFTTLSISSMHAPEEQEFVLRSVADAFDRSGVGD